MSRNPETCPHNITDTDDGELYCVECGNVLETEVVADFTEDGGIDLDELLEVL